MASEAGSFGTYLVVQRLRLCIFNARDMGSIPRWGTRFLLHVGNKKKGAGSFGVCSDSLNLDHV